MPLGWSILVLVIYALACARVTRLVNSDTILDVPRLWLARRVREFRRLFEEATVKGRADEVVELYQRRQRLWSTTLYFVQCPWCVGWWVCLASAILPVRIVGWPWWALFPVALAASQLVGVFAFASDTEDVEITDADE